ncbi:MAG: chemotaxis protein CheW [Acidobacteriia bacterium]|nr:chemotaxis protein CheW [Terriglobia bacterium]
MHFVEDDPENEVAPGLPGLRGGLELGRRHERPDRSGSALLCPAGERSVALVVDEVLGRREVVVKPLRPPLGLLKEYSGAALLEDGSVVLVLDPAALLP